MKRFDFDALADRVRNWGKWGPRDNRGTLNHIGPDVLQRAIAAARQGKLFSLGMRFEKSGPQPEHARMNPHLYMNALDKIINPEFPTSRYSEDVVHMSLQCATQWDALSHVHYDGLLYNGCKACDVLSAAGASRLGVEHLAAPGIMSRGVLVDIARLHGVDMLPATHVITPDELNRALERQGTALDAGDILLVRTGIIRHYTINNDRAAYFAGNPGLAPECAGWLYDHSLAAVCSDNLAVEVLDETTLGGDVPLPMHMLCLRDMGMPLGEMFDLETLSADCAQDGQYTFLLSAPPLGFTGAVGSPVNPQVLK